MTQKEPPETQRIDKWLWRARFYKTRAVASKAVTSGGIRLTRNQQTQRISKASFCVQPGDTLAFTKGARLFVVNVLFCALRRGPATEAIMLYENHSPPPPPKEPNPGKPATAFEREKGTGRPTKKDRRALDAIR